MNAFTQTATLTGIPVADEVPLHQGERRQPAGIWPGLALAAAIAAIAFALRLLPGVSSLSPMILAIMIGMVFHNIVGTPAWARPGVLLSLRKVLRLAIVLLGLQLTAQQVAAVGAGGIGLIALTL